MNREPTVSVIMSTYNTPAEWLCQSIDSILAQTYQDFEFLIVNDCPETPIDSVKERYCDKRIVWLDNDENLGLTKTLNKLLRLAKGKYIARMDADDVSLPERFEKQVKWMEDHPEVIVCGSYRRAFGKEEKDEIWNIPTTREEQQVQLFFSNVGLTHPTAMFRKKMLDEYKIWYNERYFKAQDYGIWVQCTRYAPMAMIPKVLLMYRKSDSQISSAGRTNQLEMDALIKLDQLQALGLKPTDKEKQLHIAFCKNDTNCNPNEMEDWLRKVLNANTSIQYMDHRQFGKVLGRKWYLWCKKAYIDEHKAEAKSAYRKAANIGNIAKDIELHLKLLVAHIIRK